MHPFDPALLRDRKKQRQTLIAVPLVLITAVPVIDHFIPPYIHLAPMLAIVPALTATFATPRTTALVGAASVAALAVAGADRHVLVTENLIVQILSLAALSALMVLFCHLRERHERDLVRIRSVSDAAQRVLLRPLPDRAGPVSIASEYHAAEADTQIGGDLYAVARTPCSTRLVIGDVRGKGLASISDTAIVLEAFRAAVQRRSSLPEMVAQLEDGLQWGMTEFSAADGDLGERFVTALVADIPDDEPVVHLISCGHPQPLRLCGGEATPLHVSRPAPPLGLGALSDNPPHRAQTFPFAHGDLLLLYTDGVTEARDPHRAFYPLAERAAAWSGCAPDRLVRKVVADLEHHVGGAPNDDMAVVAVRREEPTRTLAPTCHRSEG